MWREVQHSVQTPHVSNIVLVTSVASHSTDDFNAASDRFLSSLPSSFKKQFIMFEFWLFSNFYNKLNIDSQSDGHSIISQVSSSLQGLPETISQQILFLLSLFYSFSTSKSIELEIAGTDFNSISQSMNLCFPE